MIDTDPLFNFHLNRPYTDDEIKSAYLHFREAYYKVQSEGATERGAMNAALEGIRDYRMAREGSHAERVSIFAARVLSDMAELRAKILQRKPGFRERLSDYLSGWCYMALRKMRR